MKWIAYLLLPLYYNVTLAQATDIKPYLKAWSKADKGQSYASQVFFDSLFVNKNNTNQRKKYLNNIVNLQKYLNNHADTRLQVRLIMFEIIAAREYGFSEKYYSIIDEAIKMAYPLHDEQLNAELYSIRADIPPKQETHLLYNLKAIEIQRKIGFQYFPYVSNRFFGASSSLYNQGDFVQSISYGTELIKLWDLDTIHRDNAVLIFQYDLLGAAFRSLNKYDSSIYYYNKILENLNTVPSKSFRQLWSGIAAGNIGISYTNLGKYKEAFPLLQEYHKASSALGDSLNISMAQNAFANYYLKQKDYRKALYSGLIAYNIANNNNYYKEIITATEYLSNIYKYQRNIDSAFCYFDLNHNYKTKLAEEYKNSQFSLINAKIAFDNLQYSFFSLQSIAIKERNIRNAILIGIILIVIIALLLYSKKITGEKLKLKEAELKHAIAEKDIYDAQQKINQFKHNIIEKNNQINNLQKQLIDKTPTSINNVEKLLEEPLLTEDDWEKFRREFLKAYPSFFSMLCKDKNNFTPAMERLAALIFLQFNNYQIANTLGISKDSVARSKRRLKVLLNLDNNTPLEEHIITHQNKLYNH